MDILSELEKVMLVVSIAGYALLAIQLQHRRLASHYPWFTRYLWAEALAVSVIATFLFLRAYSWMALAYIVLQPVLWIFYVLIVRELYSHALTGYTGIARYARRALLGGLILAIIISVASLGADVNLARHRSLTILYVTAVHRAVASTVTIFLVLLTAFLASFPIQLPRNTLFHVTLFFVYFLSLSIGHFYRNLTGTEATQLSNVLLLTLTNLCLGLWLWRFQPSGELRRHPAKLASGSAGRMLGRLDELNRILTAATRADRRE